MNSSKKSVTPEPPVLLIGIGNKYRSDDGLGLYVVREIRRRSHGFLRIIEQSGEGTSLMESWKGASHVFIVDAVSSGELPGTLHRLDVGNEIIPTRLFRSSSHAFGVGEAIEMAKGLHDLPQTLILYGIEAESLDPGIGLSAPVVKSVYDLIHVIENDVAALIAGLTSHEPHYS